MKTKLLLSIILFSFISVISSQAQVPTRTGWWKFDDQLNIGFADLGNDLEIVGTAESVDGPVAGNKAVKIGIGSYFKMTHGIFGNGGGTLVNDYSLQIDFKVPEVGIWHCFFQTDPTNAGDGDLFTNSSSNAIGTVSTTYSSKGVAADTWYRMIVSVKNGEFFTIYIDGTLWLDGNIQSIDGRYALPDVLLMFADNDGEDGEIICSELGIWDFALDEYEVIALGDAKGERVRDRSKMGWWKFDDSSDMLKAEIGLPLVLTGSQESVEGPAEGNLATKIGVGSFLSLSNDIAPNDGHTLVNEYSIQIDFKVPEAGIVHSFYQTDPTNTSNADLITNTGNSIGTDETGFSSKTIIANPWYRMIISVKNGEFYKVYVNGELWLNAPAQDIDGRFALDKSLLLFADNDGEDGIIICSEIILWEVALTENEVIDLGVNPANLIPARFGWWKFDDAADLLKADIGVPLELTGFQEATDGPVTGNGAVGINLGSYLAMHHGISPNGDGIMVNEYSLQIDFSVPTQGVWHCFFQTDPTNVSDGDLFTNLSNSIGTAGTGYTLFQISNYTWYRMVLSVKNGVHFRIYIDGENWLNAAGQMVDGRWALDDVLLMFADNDIHNDLIHCSELAIWDFALNSEQVEKLGDAETEAVVSVKDKQLTGTVSQLGQNYPNPFSFSTNFPYKVNKTGEVSFKVFDISGKQMFVINEGLKSPGNYSLEMFSDKLDNGVYYVQMTNGNNTNIRKMIIVK